jgi:flagellar biosynthesis/type III secretory pathway protein FliH
MAKTLTINLNKPVTSVNILDNHNQLPACNYAQNQAEDKRQDTEKRGEGSLETAFDVQDSERQRQELSQLYDILKNLINRFNQLCDEVISKHKEDIAKLSVEIARKILMQKVQKGDYEIESIIQEVLKSAPTNQELVVHLNPEDLTLFQKHYGTRPKAWTGSNPASRGPTKTLPDVQISGIDNIKFVSDHNIGRAECLLETQKGIVTSFIEEHIERISEALEKI